MNEGTAVVGHKISRAGEDMASVPVVRARVASVTVLPGPSAMWNTFHLILSYSLKTKPNKGLE